MKTKVYVAGGSREMDKFIVPYMHSLTEAGVEVAHNWPQVIKSRDKGDAQMSPAEIAPFANEDLVGIQKSNILWLVVPEGESTGCWVELGFALAFGKFVVVSGNLKKCIFVTQAHLCFDKHDDAFRQIVDFSNRRVRVGTYYDSHTTFGFTKD